MVAVTYGPGLVTGGVLVPSDMLESFPPWSTDSVGDRPQNGLLADQVQQDVPVAKFRAT